MARKKKNWDRVRKMQDRDKNEYRDVYEDQQLDRSEIDEKQTMTSRRILIFFFSLFIFVVAYFVLSFVQMGLDNFNDMTGETTETIEDEGEDGDEATNSLDGDLTEHSDPIKGTYFIDSEGKVYRTKDDYVIGKEDPYFYLEEKSDPMIGRYYVDKDGNEYKDYDEYRLANPDLFEDIDDKGNSLVETEPAVEGAEGADDVEDAVSSGATQDGFATYLAPVKWKIIVSALIALLVALMMETIAQRNLAAQNLMSDTSDINQYQNDQHIMLPEEMQRKFDWFPDVGAHSNVQVSSMISHMMLSNKGIKKIEMSDRAKKDILDEDGDIEYYEGEVVVDEDGEPITNTTPMFDKQFGEALFDASGMIKDKKMRKYYDPATIPYNKGNTDREKLKGFDTLADLINKDWIFPSYEPQRPAGAYVVDTAPVNTMVLAITRAGKGQTVIEPTIDMWTRERRPNNMVINDPKGELLVKNYVKGTMRGYQIVQFNLINSIKTDIYDPLGLAADAAREGDFTKCALYVENIADVFFPLDGGEDPVWPNAANNAFKRAAYGLIDYYLEEEKELRSFAEKTNMDEVVLESKIDGMWGKVTLYNCYQLFVQLTSKKLKNPAIEFTKKAKAGEYDDITDEEYNMKLAEVTTQAVLWEDRPETDLLTLYFNATDKLPRNSMRTLVSNVNNALKAMAGAEKMMASVYGIAITAMSFFTDPTISTLTSGTPSQNVDLAGLSFPRRLGVRFHSDFITRYHLIGSQAVWDSFEDKEFTKLMGDEFHHEDLISREGWAKYYFKGIYPKDIAYVRLKLINPQTGMLIRTFYFQFKKSYQMSLDSRHYITDPVLGTKIIKNGILTELKRFKTKEEKIVYKKAKTTFKQMKIKDLSMGGKKEEVQVNAITRTMTRYSEKPKMIFLVTPPHLSKYAKLILILIKQLVDLNFDQSYMSKSDQKPLYKTRFMLDELGNLQSEGHGIQGFETMLSIGLGQEQQFTIILQTLQQLRDVYGDSVDKIVQGNAQPLTSKVLTPDGWKLMGDIEVGDEVLTPFGTVSKVTGVYPKGKRPVYNVVLRDGSQSEACDEHLWAIERHKTNIEYHGLDENGEKIYKPYKGQKTCKLVDEVIDTMELKERVDKGRLINLPKIKPVAYPEKDLPIHPYVLGYLIGDATFSDKGHVVLALDDKDVEVKTYMESLGYEFTRTNSTSISKTPTYYVKGVCSAVRSLSLQGKVSFEKFIPQAYMYGSVEQRTLLLQGLMDSDGTISKSGEMEFTSASEQLALDVQALVRSLGGRVSINVKTNVFYTSPTQQEKKRARDAYRVQNIRLFYINPFKLERKASRWRSRNDSSGNRVVLVDYVRDDEVQCIRIEDERHLYITDDYIPTHNTSNIVFLKSTDDSMLDTLQKMSGTTHKAFTDSKTITKDMENVLLQVDGKVSYTMTTREVPVISYNDLAFIPERNSIVFRAGNSPIWNRNETILPMSWRLFQNTITQPGKEYSLQTIPTLSSAIDFDVRKNQPDFSKMLDKRMKQATSADIALDAYRNVYDYSDFDIEQLDPDVYADEVMGAINTLIREEAGADDVEVLEFEYDEDEIWSQMAEENTEQLSINAQYQKQMDSVSKKRFAGGLLAPDDLVSKVEGVTHNYDREIINAYRKAKGAMQQDRRYFSTQNGNLHGLNGTPYILQNDPSDDLQALNQAAKSEAGSVYSEGDVAEDELSALNKYIVTDEFYRFLAGCDTWSFANNRFEQEMKRQMSE